MSDIALIFKATRANEINATFLKSAILPTLIQIIVTFIFF